MSADWVGSPDRGSTAEYVRACRVEDIHPSHPRLVLIGESPHTDEVARPWGERSPFVGAAGKRLWTFLYAWAGEAFPGGPQAKVPPRSELEAFARRHRLALMNAVRYPMDPRIFRNGTTGRSRPKSDGQRYRPRDYLGFEKPVPGSELHDPAFSYGRVYTLHTMCSPDFKNSGSTREDNPVRVAIDDMVRRIPREVSVVCLGKTDVTWFVRQGGLNPTASVAHPATWYNSKFRQEAHRILTDTLNTAGLSVENPSLPG